MRQTFTIIVETTGQRQAGVMRKRWARFVKYTGRISGVAVLSAEQVSELPEQPPSLRPFGHSDS